MSSIKIIRHTSVHELHAFIGLGKPRHPLITIIDTAKLAYGEEYIGQRITSDLYCIALKDSACGIDYGRNPYDFDEGVLIFTAPDQVITATKAQALDEVQGWMLYFHPDLIRNTSLGGRIGDYTFFSYDVHEALHLSEQEQATVTHCVDLIETEIRERIDSHSQQVLVSTIELLLNYCTRYYERQFNTRVTHHRDMIAQVEFVLRDYFKSGKLLEFGPPSVQYLADQCHRSPTYLSDLLKKETGRTAKTHINDFLVDQAKHLLLTSEDSISGIAYTLGFNYPHYFSRLFKRKTGMTPQQYRET